MNQKFRTLMLAAVVTAVAAPAMADTVCTVNATELRLRKSPSMHAKVIAVLKQNQQVTTTGDCTGGWVKIASTDGKLSGYVGGWALTSQAPKAAAAEPVATAAPAPAPATPAPVPEPEVAKGEPAINVTAPHEAPSNEKLAMQITELRLNVLGIERDMDKMSKEIQKIKSSLPRKKGSRKSAKKN
jgi:uncharacterized protein YgiM (DUF1202 family)